MFKYFTLALIGIFFLGCKSDVDNGVSGTKEEKTNVYEIDEVRMSLPVAYEFINSSQELTKIMDAKGQNILKNDPELMNFIAREMNMNRMFYFDGKSSEQLNFVYVDRTGPRFPFTEKVISMYITMYETQCASRYPDGDYRVEKLDQKLLTVWENEILKVRHKHIKGNMEWYTNQYLMKMKSTKRTLLIWEYNYNGGKTDLERYITTIY